LKTNSIAQILLIPLILITGCTRSTEEPSASGDAVVVFENQNYPFTFSVPSEFYTNRFTQVDPNSGKQTQYFEIAELNGIGLSQLASFEAPLDTIEVELQKAFAVQQPILAREKHGGLEMVVFEGDIVFASNVPGHSLSYFFPAGGGSWQIEFYSTEEYSEQVGMASKVVMDSIRFNP
jgi:hypothetical protein